MQMLSTQEKKELKQEIKSNQHEVFVISIEEMDAIVRSSPKGTMPHIKSTWQNFKGKAEAGASYYASADDLRTLSKLVGDLGGFSTKAYVKTYGGKAHIILNGHPGLRRVLTGTKYGIKNPKVITMGLGKAGAVHAAKSGGILSIILLSAYRIADYVLTDQATLTQLIGSLATDIVKVGIATGASIAAASAIVAMGFTIAIGPIAAVVLVGIGVSMALSALDEHYGITDRVIAGLDDIVQGTDRGYEAAKQALYRNASELADSAFDYTVDSARAILINITMHAIDRFISTRPRLQ
ncbi:MULTISPECIES: hypothetical protein [unclassified Pseudomonas]|uniref:hypothetical protein n=1 Tax=unclassified Pseudomonas TaxID=196821 RepID=UPI0024468D12|nr:MULTISPECIES: hypothetical protein [unclassified Pseudomonas]MDG9926944.1 hypothetical protein [Pseudomonas sp. GD04042]MDH0484587.1 hypothetical protein [Pseudomonas sp. GD04015]MDH0602359.1 hypothetical protein [Pseudomonas sp. GD03869]